VDVVVETTSVVEAGWLPELATHLATVVIVEDVLRNPADREETDAVGLATRVVATEVTMEFRVSLVLHHLV
jgi:hypothetical protein